MKAYQFIFKQHIPISVEQAWDFFSSPLNLAKITPSDMAFNVTSEFADGTKMYPGMIITYKVSPLAGISIDWMTEITHVKDLDYFVDEQRFGPYKFWHHMHKFEKTETGIMMIDTVTYGLSFGFLGRIANTVLVESKLKNIFNYRKKAVEELFGV